MRWKVCPLSCVACSVCPWQCELYLFMIRRDSRCANNYCGMLSPLPSYTLAVSWGSYIITLCSFPSTKSYENWNLVAYGKVSCSVISSSFPLSAISGGDADIMYCTVLFMALRLCKCHFCVSISNVHLHSPTFNLQFAQMASATQIVYVVSYPLWAHWWMGTFRKWCWRFRCFCCVVFSLAGTRGLLSRQWVAPHFGQLRR